MRELNDFYNEGFGWICKHCERDLALACDPFEKQSRILREGEAETKNPVMANIALAKWADPAHRTLVCPRCGITELADIR